MGETQASSSYVQEDSQAKIKHGTSDRIHWKKQTGDDEVSVCGSDVTERADRTYNITDAGSDTTYTIDDDHIDISRQAQKDFFGNVLDSTKTYHDHRNTQNQTDSREFYGHVLDSTDAVSNRTYSIDDHHPIDTTKIRNSQRDTDSRDFYGNVLDSTKTIKSDATYTIDDDRMDTARIHNAQRQQTDSHDFYAHGMDSAATTVKNVYDTSAVQNTIGTKGRVLMDNLVDSTDVIYSNDRNYGKTGWNGKFTYETPVKPKSKSAQRGDGKDPSPPLKAKPSETPSRSLTAKGKESKTTIVDDVNKKEYVIIDGVKTSIKDLKTFTDDVTKTKYVIIDGIKTAIDSTDSNTIKDVKTFRDDVTKTEYVIIDGVKTSVKDSTKTIKSDAAYSIDADRMDMARIHNDQRQQTDSHDFYAHGMDSAATTVKNVYDTLAVQNTIGTKGRVLMDNLVDSTDVIYSNDRNYGKTGWNGKFTYEIPVKPKSKSP